ncbi:MAG: hypothetical protein RIS47_1168 [Bacteroidota bacterium]
MKKIILVLWVVAVFMACNTNGPQNTNAIDTTTLTKTVVPSFNQDSALSYVKSQLDFGPRVPSTPGHEACGDYIVARLKAFNAQVVEQKAPITTFDGKTHTLRNIIGSYKAENSQRVLLMAHWDTRPFADNSPDSIRMKPIPGANDGASGVAVLLEIARAISQQAPNVGVDIVFFDLEDYGAPRWSTNQAVETWCLGSQYWAKKPHVERYTARFGVLVDMVGAPGATFTREALSMHFAESTVNKVWTAAGELGYGNYFSYDKTPQIIDDHMFVNQIANIPSIDIIHHDETSENYFGSYWHTHDDNFAAVDAATLRAVGQTLLKVIYNE